MSYTVISIKESRLSIRTTEPEKLILAEAAHVRRMNTSQFVLQSSLDAAQAILADRTEFKLSPKQWSDFCNRLDEPGRAIPELVDLFRDQPPADV